MNELIAREITGGLRLDFENNISAALELTNFVKGNFTLGKHKADPYFIAFFGPHIGIDERPELAICKAAISTLNKNTR